LVVNIKMTSYVTVKVNVSDHQANNIRKAVEYELAVSIRLSHSDLVGKHVIHVTQTLAKQIEKHRAEKTGMIQKIK